jgi:hypothetical protein
MQGGFMKLSHLALMLCCLGFSSLFLVNCGGSSSPTSSATATPTPSGTQTVVPSFNLTGTVTYTGTIASGHKLYIVYGPVGGNVTAVTSPISSGGTYSITGLTTATNMYAAYDNTGNGIAFCSGNLQQGNCTTLTGSGDVVCLVGYSGGCPNTNGGVSGTSFTTTQTKNITFAGSGTTADGTSCTQ